MKKHPLYLLTATVGLALVVSVVGCGGRSVVVPQTNSISGTVYDNGIPVNGATVMVCFSGDSTLVTSTNQAGHFESEFQNGLSVKGILAVTLGKTGMIEVGNKFAGLNVDIAPLPSLSRATPTATTGEYWFGVYSTDGNGDVKFRYQFWFSRYVCVNSLPWIWWGSWQNPDPNSWLSWNLTGFPVPWKGKFLAVPTRLQWWHSAYYGYPIQRALYLIAIG